MKQLFNEQANTIPKNVPLAERMRPSNIDEFIGQSHLVGRNSPLRKFLESGEFPSIIFWGPPGVGKTTFAKIIAKTGNFDFNQISAVESGIKDIRNAINKAKYNLKKSKDSLLFIDEIHRFNKSQQDALLHAVEQGIITLIGATTENPSFEVNSALLSRCNVYKLKTLTEDEIKKVILRAIEHDPKISKYDIVIDNWDPIINMSNGDARTALNALESALRLEYSKDTKKIILNSASFEKALLKRMANYDKKGDNHYDNISALIKSLRGSDPDASMLWMVKMLELGEDPKFIARRLIIFASEDIGNADPHALQVAINCFKAVEIIGLPEAGINLAQAVTYLASAPKSNASYKSLRKAQAYFRNNPDLQVPLHLRNAPTDLMKDEGYGKDYKYPHDYDEHFVNENYFPENKKPVKFYNPTTQGIEIDIKKRLEKYWKNREEN